jgi:DNA-binding transcriptional MerR regulator
MMTVTDIARRFNVSADAIRYYTTLGLLSPIRDAVNGYRRYGSENESRLRFLLSAKKLGFSLKDIRQILLVAETANTPCPLVRRLMDQRLGTLRQQLRETQALYERMKLAASSWEEQPDQVPTRNTICDFIENWDNTGAFVE